MVLFHYLISVLLFSHNLFFFFSIIDCFIVTLIYNCTHYLKCFYQLKHSQKTTTLTLLTPYILKVFLKNMTYIHM